MDLKTNEMLSDLQLIIKQTHKTQSPFADKQNCPSIRMDSLAVYRSCLIEVFGRHT
jgi:hypothetical protein